MFTDFNECAICAEGKDARVRDMEICVELWWEIMVGSCEVRP